MDAPEISTLHEEEEESPPPEGLSFTKFRVHVGRPWAPGGSGSASGAAGPAGSPVGHRGEDSEDEEEEDQLIDDDELAIVTETGHGPATPSSVVATGTPTSSPKKRGSATRGRARRGGAPGRRGRPGREPPDAAAMMSTFEVAKTEQQVGMDSAQIITPATAGSSQVQGSDDHAWSTTAPPKPPRKKPGPKKGTTLGPRGPRKGTSKYVYPNI